MASFWNLLYAGVSIGLTGAKNVVSNYNTTTKCAQALSTLKTTTAKAQEEYLSGGINGNYQHYPVPYSDGIQVDETLKNLNDGYSKVYENFTQFDRFYTINLAEDMPSGRHYVFFCRPDLYLLEQASDSVTLSTESRVAKDPFFQGLATTDQYIVRSLCAEFGTGAPTADKYATASGYGNSTTVDGTTDLNGVSLTIHSLIPLLTGRCESIQLPDYSIKTYTLSQPYTKYSLPFSLTAVESTTGGSFDIAFREDGNYTITKMFYAWIYYMDGVMRNKFTPKKKYMQYNALDYATSVYDIVVDPTGEKIVWFGKYTGVIPTSVPISDLGWNKGGSPNTSVNITFNYFNYEPMNPEILADFNYNSLGYIYMNTYAKNTGITMPYVPIYDENLGGIGKARVGRPFIVQDTSDGGFRLLWAPPA